jgi:gamma-glutamylcyclotransferase (GGCT)/AIG2-like uncharacterized protein YtfP
MDNEQMCHRTPWAKRIGWARLRHWSLEFRGVANVRQQQDTEVLGTLWHVTPSDLARLDQYEGYPHLYDRQVVTVDTANGKKKAIVYVMTGAAGRRARHYLSAPSRFYLDGIRAGYQQLRLPERGLDAAVAESQPNYSGLSQTQFSYDVPREFEMRTCEWCGECDAAVDHDDPSIPADCCQQCWEAAVYLLNYDGAPSAD